MAESPVKKKVKTCNNNIQENSMEVDEPCPQGINEKNTAAAYSRRKNFIEACKKVSKDSYYNFKERFMMFYVPKCVNNRKHKERTNSPTPISASMEESFKIGMKTNSWFEVLDNFHMCLKHNPDQFLTTKMLKDVVEIILNAHKDDFSEHSLTVILDKCRMILSMSFNKYPLCKSTHFRETYINFLNEPMELKEYSFTNRQKFGSNKGIVKYCWNRLENEMLSELDEPLINRIQYTPEDMKQSVKGLFWQKQKLEIFETLSRSDRIDRLMLVLDSLIELLQLDLVIWHSHSFSYSTDLGVYLMKTRRPLMAAIMWSDCKLYTGALTDFCQQIMRIFVDFVCLDYPKHHIKTVTIWLNTIIETLYMCDTGSNSDYPNTGFYINYFADTFYEILQGLSSSLLIKVLKCIKPLYMRCIVGVLHLKRILNTTEDNILVILNDFLRNSTWLRFPTDNRDNENLNDNLKLPKTFHNFFHSDFMELDNDENMKTKGDEDIFYPKQDNKQMSNIINQKDIILLLYITFDAYLESYQVLKIINTISDLNQRTDMICDTIDDDLYSISEEFVKKYRSIYQLLKEIIIMLDKLSSIEHLKIFNRLISL